MGWSFEFLTHPQRGEGAEARKSVNFKSHQQSCFLITFLSKKSIFKDLDEHYTNNLSLPMHHNPPPHNKSCSFSTEIKLDEEPWDGDPYKPLENPCRPLHILTTCLLNPYKSLEILRNPQRGEGAEARKSGNVKSSQKSCFLKIFLVKRAIVV